MKKALFLLPLLFILACGGSRRDKDIVDDLVSEISKSADYSEPGHNFWMEGYQVMDTVNNYVVFPLWLGTLGDNKGSIRNLKGRNSPQNSYWNLLFYNPISKEKHLLYEGKAIIRDYAPHEKAADRIFYRVIQNDFNGDGKLDLKDPTQLCVSFRNGRDFRSLTPPDKMLVGWNFYEDTWIILAEVIRDTDNDKEFTSNDPREYLRIDLSEELPAEPAFEPAFLEELEKILKQNFPPETDE